MSVMIRTKKHCRFAGNNYAPGQVVPAEAVDKKSIGRLVRMNFIALEDDPKPIELKPDPKPKKKR